MLVSSALLNTPCPWNSLHLSKLKLQEFENRNGFWHLLRHERRYLLPLISWEDGVVLVYYPLIPTKSFGILKSLLRLLNLGLLFLCSLHQFAKPQRLIQIYLTQLF